MPVQPDASLSLDREIGLAAIETISHTMFEDAISFANSQSLATMITGKPLPKLDDVIKAAKVYSHDMFASNVYECNKTLTAVNAAIDIAKMVFKSSQTYTLYQDKWPLLEDAALKIEYHKTTGELYVNGKKKCSGEHPEVSNLFYAWYLVHTFKTTLTTRLKSDSDSDTSFYADVQTAWSHANTIAAQLRHAVITLASAK